MLFISKEKVLKMIKEEAIKSGNLYREYNKRSSDSRCMCVDEEQKFQNGFDINSELAKYHSARLSAMCALYQKIEEEC